MVLPHTLDAMYHTCVPTVFMHFDSTYSPSFESTRVGSVTRVLMVQIQL